ncbi:sodium:solute symporter family protein [Natronobiforma cellulositropha]|uniref:sodium:solute symporter family protein n=1 Tax=Natronobiforma cellulositropha TaxID=1679076 RepID=UPI0021D5B5B3|nr:sodium:solute symporter family protein [Natronobiforma cellulositropha]
MSEINTLYLGAFVVYMLVILGVGLLGYQRVTNTDDFWIFGRELGPWLATMSYVAHFVSAVSIIGFVGAVFGQGYSTLTGIILGLMLGISGFYFVVPKIREFGSVTLSDIVVELTGYDVARPLTGTVLLANAWVFLIIQLTGASVLVATLTGVPYTYMVLIIGAVFTAYAALGGLVSVSYTDFVQGLLMVGLVAVAFVYLVADLGGITSINQQFTALDPTYTAPFGAAGFAALGFLGALITFFGSIFTSQSEIIRTNAIRDDRTARFHVAAGGVIVSVFYVVLMIVGAATVVALHNAGVSVSNPDEAFPLLLTEYLPTSLGIVISVAILSGILSTTDTRLHACGVTCSNDIFSYFADDPDDAQLLRVSRLATVAFGIAAAAIAIDPPGTIIVMYEWRAILLTSALLVPVYAAMYLVDIPGKAIVSAIAIGFVLGTTWEFLGGPLGLPAALLATTVAFVVLLAGRALWGSRLESRESKPV